MREVQGERVSWNTQMYKPLTQNIQTRCLVWYFNLRIIHMMKLIAPALGAIKPVYYPEEERLVSLDMLKLY